MKLYEAYEWYYHVQFSSDTRTATFRLGAHARPNVTRVDLEGDDALFEEFCETQRQGVAYLVQGGYLKVSRWIESEMNIPDLQALQSFEVFRDQVTFGEEEDPRRIEETLNRFRESVDTVLQVLQPAPQNWPALRLL